MTDEPAVAAITGAASGFGRAIVDELAGRGFSIAMFDLDEPRLDEAAEAVRSTFGVEVLARPVDVASRAALLEAAAAVDTRFGRCDLLWANVGVQHFGAVETITDDVWRWVLDVNVIGTSRTVQAFLPLLRRSPHARIAFTTSTNALVPAARLAAYQATKYAVVGLAETLRLELAAEPVDVSIVYPAGMITRHLESSAEARPSHLGPGTVDESDLIAMMESRPMADVDLTTAEAAAAVAVAGVLAGEPHVVTHGDLRAALAERDAAIAEAVDRAAPGTDA